jgi:membrane-bound lytic murein transglycosylase B
MNFYKFREANFYKCLAIIMLVLALVLPIFFISAQLTSQEEKAQLEAELKQLEEKIIQYEKDITKTQEEKETLSKQISILKSKIQKLNLEIQQSNLMIKDITYQIKDTESSIDKTALKISDIKENLANLLREIYIEDQKSLIEILLSEPSISNFFNNLVALNAINLKTQNLFQEMKTQKAYLEGQKQSLEAEKEDLQRMLSIQILQKQSVESSHKAQEKLLAETKGKESLYQKLLQETQKRAAEIRARIFELAAVPKAPTFGEAYEIAKYVSSITGVRPALLLAVLTQESNLGKNVGQCNCPTCKYPNLKLDDVMKKDRDLEPFLEICRELGRDPYTTPVSCPMYMNGKKVGYGGAMGPAQFLPSTWLLYKDKIEAITGRKPADPWNIRDAFLAAGLYLKEYGASSKNPNDEWRAAMIYFSGSTNKKYRFYGDSVLSIASRYEEDIKAIEMGLGLGFLESQNNWF